MASLSEPIPGGGVLDRRSGEPLHTQITRILAAEIRAGGDPPPMTERELTERFRVSRATVRHALQSLVAQGVIYRERAKGTFPVRQLGIERPAGLSIGSILEHLVELGLDPTSRVSDVRRTAPEHPIARHLDLEPGETVLRFARLVLVGEDPLSLADIAFRTPPDFLPSPAELETSGSAMSLAESRYGLRIARVEHRVWARGADDAEAAALRIGPGEPVLEIESLMFARDGRPVGWRRLVDRGQAIRHAFSSN